MEQKTRTLRFIVNGQLIDPDPDCDFSGLVPGTEGYLRAEFAFSDEWDRCIKVASFWSTKGVEFTPQVLKDGYSCMIPSDALAHATFKVQVVGKLDNFKIVTNKTTVHQNGG